MRVPAAALLLLLAGPAASQTRTVEVDGIQFQIGDLGDSDVTVQWKYLAQRKKIDSSAKLAKVAREALIKNKTLPFELQRIEVAGMLAVDETNEGHSDMFNKRLKLSNLNDPREKRGFLRDTWRALANRGKDLTEALSDTRGIPTARSAEIIADLKGKKINELFAHSWGTEAVYLGILSGEIIPPKKLVIVGVPEANEEKWLALAKFTGIQVHVVGFEYDKVRIAGNLGIKLKSGLPKDRAGLEALWTSRCAERRGRGCADPQKFVRTKFDYNVGIQPPNAPKDEFFRMHLSKMDHDRMLYYRYLYNRNIFNKTPEQLEAPQVKLVKAEENRILAEAMIEARSMIEAAEAAAQIVADAEAATRPNRLWDDLNSPEGRRRLAELKEVGPPPSAHVRPADVAPARAVAVTNFVSMLPNIRAYAESSCRSPGTAPVPSDVKLPLDHIHFLAMDGREIDRLSAGLGACELRLFHRLIEVIRLGQGRGVTSEWVARTARSYMPSPVRQQQPDVRPREPEEPERPGNPGCSPQSGVWGCPVD